MRWVTPSFTWNSGLGHQTRCYELPTCHMFWRLRALLTTDWLFPKASAELLSFSRISMPRRPPRCIAAPRVKSSGLVWTNTVSDSFADVVFLFSFRFDRECCLAVNPANLVKAEGMTTFLLPLDVPPRLAVLLTPIVQMGWYSRALSRASSLYRESWKKFMSVGNNN